MFDQFSQRVIVRGVLVDVLDKIGIDSVVGSATAEECQHRT